MVIKLSTVWLCSCAIIITSSCKLLFELIQVVFETFEDSVFHISDIFFHGFLGLLNSNLRLFLLFEASKNLSEFGELGLAVYDCHGIFSSLARQHSKFPTTLMVVSFHLSCQFLSNNSHIGA